ncbi:sulfurtransferase [Spirochaeta dissipatitropha]
MIHGHALIQVEELAEQVDAFLLIDCRGKADFKRGRIPGAVNLPANELQDPDSERGALLPLSELAEKIASAGIRADSRLVLYDDSGLVPSSRLFWVLGMLGKTDALLLDGGGLSWIQSGKKFDTSHPEESASVNESELSETERMRIDPETVKSVLAEQADVYAAIDDQDTVIIDTRTELEYSGQQITADRNGHIPGAVHINWENNIRDLFDPRFRSHEELREMYRQRGVVPEKHVIVYCRSGSRSTHTFFTLKMLGFTNVRNYAGSWLEWGNDPETPIST